MILICSPDELTAIISIIPVCSATYGKYGSDSSGLEMQSVASDFMHFDIASGACICAAGL
jgi:hypothetical protein